MKTSKTFTFNKSTFILLGLFFTLFLFSNTSFAQEMQVKGIVKGKSGIETEVLSGATVYLKGTNEATSSNRKGEFTFPKKLKEGDVLIFSYLGYIKKRVKIQKNITYLNVILNEDETQILGALNNNKRFKSKHSKQ